MKQRKWTVDYLKDVNWVCKFIHKYLKLDPQEKVVSQSHYSFIVNLTILIIFAVPLRQSNIRTIARSDPAESLRVLWQSKQAHPALFHLASLGLRRFFQFMKNNKFCLFLFL